MSKTLAVFWIILVVLLSVYSYGFVDFNLTLSAAPVVTHFIAIMQGIALFHRPLSTLIFLTLTTFCFFLYLYTVTSAKTHTFPWKIIIILAVILALGYPLLSSDVFKYLFSAKTVIVYHQNPHLVAPQVFEGDLWLRFMRWIHTPSPYGPLQTILAIPYYLLGFGKFVPILYLYRLDQVFWYLLTIWAIEKLGGSVKTRLYFALNPLILYEWLLNSHNDAIMIALSLTALVLLRNHRQGWGLVALLGSIGIKYITLIFLPFIFLPRHFLTRYLTPYALLCLAVAPLLYHYQVQYQPWYVTWLIPFAALTPSRYLKWVVGAYSLGALLRYIPYLQTGLWEGTMQTFALLTFLPPILMALGYNGVHAVYSQVKKT